jgi:hypothetical protein
LLTYFFFLFDKTEPAKVFVLFDVLPSRNALLALEAVLDELLTLFFAIFSS